MRSHFHQSDLVEVLKQHFSPRDIFSRHSDALKVSLRNLLKKLKFLFFDIRFILGSKNASLWRPSTNRPWGHPVSSSDQPRPTFRTLASAWRRRRRPTMRQPGRRRHDAQSRHRERLSCRRLRQGCSGNGSGAQQVASGCLKLWNQLQLSRFFPSSSVTIFSTRLI